ncbi:hypothetical protein [Alistipes putredinis]|uniref:hypothetical protein n=1 Tax=Alistipes putredinis TaxID=28117 RepID=UPI003992AB9A
MARRYLAWNKFATRTSPVAYVSWAHFTEYSSIKALAAFTTTARSGTGESLLPKRSV